MITNRNPKVLAKQHTTIKAIKRLVAKYFNIPIQTIDGNNRTVPLPRIRHVAMALARKYSGASFPSVARAFRKKGHRTVTFAIEATDRRCKKDPFFKATVQLIETECKALQ